MCYVIYTSGSTGKPKGTILEHRGVVNTLTTLQKRYFHGKKDTYLLKTAFTFDLSVTELFGWFHDGGRLCILEKGKEKDPQAIYNAVTVKSHSVTHMTFVPSMLSVFVDYMSKDMFEEIMCLRYVFIAGESPSVALAERFYEKCLHVKLENMYGPTEASVYSTAFSIPRRKLSQMSIGKPLANNSVYILDKKDQIVPIGVVGELCIASDGVARGYLNRKELTAGRSFDKNKRMYRTGDLARWLPDGNLEFLGRIDNQVKVRGYRIE